MPLHSADRFLPEAAAHFACHYEGVTEAGDNRGEEVEMFIRRGGGQPGWPWCMYFVYFCFDSTANLIEEPNPLKRTGSCARQIMYANKFGSGIRVIKFGKVFGVSEITGKRGDILIFKHGTPLETDIGRLWNGHTGIYLDKMNKSVIYSIEGNTNSSGSREGDGVYFKERNVFSRKLPLIGIIRIE